MILSCPACGTRYRVDERDLAVPSGRTVRCASCGHLWLQEPPVIGDQADHTNSRAGAARVEPVGVTRPPAASASDDLHQQQTDPRRSANGQSAKDGLSLAQRRGRAVVPVLVVALLLTAAVLLTVVAGFFARRELVSVWPPAGQLFGAIGLGVEPIGAGLAIEKIVPARTADGLIIDGEIANLGKTPADVPRLRVALQNAADQDLQSKIVDPPKTRLQPGETANFSTPFAHPGDGATGVVVTFVSR